MPPDPLGSGLHERGEGPLGSYLHAIRAHRLLVVLTTVLAVGSCLAWLAVRSPSYEATAQLLVTPLPQGDKEFLGVAYIRDSGDPTRTVQTAATLLEGPSSAGRTALALGGGWTRKKVEDAIDVQAIGESNVIGVKARTDSPQLAARLANLYVESALGLRRERLRKQVASALAGLQPERSQAEAERVAALAPLADGHDPTLTGAQGAVAPTSASGPPDWLLVLLSLIAGGTLGAAAALVAERLDRRVRDADDLLRIYPLAVLSRIPSVRRLRSSSGSALTVPARIREAYRTLQVQVSQGRSEPRRVLVTSASRGDGKTTSAINLAAALVTAGHRVILVDCDLRKPEVARRLGITPRATLVDKETLSEVIESAPGLPSLGVVTAAPGHPAGIVVERIGGRLARLLDAAAEQADYLVLDTAPLGEISDALRLVPLVDDVLVVARVGNTDRGNLEFLRSLLERSGCTPIGLAVIDAEPASAGYYGYYGDDDGAWGEERKPSRARTLLRR